MSRSDRAPRRLVGFSLLGRAGLLTSVSAVALLAASPEVAARPLGGPTATPSAAAIAAVQAQQAEAQRSALAAQNALKRATLSVQAIQATQQAARDAARAALGLIPNGLQTGGLMPQGGLNGAKTNGASTSYDTPTSWIGVEQRGADGEHPGLSQTTGNGRSQVTIKQTQQKAILNWQTFNVGKETDLYFDQRAGGANAKDWIALNRVLDPSTAPSRVLGTIKAEGQVYVINRNGIIFGGASQVNVNTLVASSLSLSDQQFQAGINTTIIVGNNMHLPQFGDYNPNIPNTQKPATDPGQPAPFMPTSVPGSVVVEAGAEVAATGGKVMLFAPKVINSGHVSAQDGQVIMAAGEQVYLKTNESTLPDVPLVVRGLDVAVTAPTPWLFNYDQLKGALSGLPLDNPNVPPLYSEGPYGQSIRDIMLPWMYERAATAGYQVVNNGIVEANHGNITVMARDIVQNGLLSASTALNNRDGSIRLLAYSNGVMASNGDFNNKLMYWQTGSVHLMPGSVTSAMPDLADASEIELSALATRYKPGRVEVRGSFIDIQSQANIVVPAGTISVFATSEAHVMDEPVRGETEVRDGSRLYIGEGAYLSVAGLKDISVAMERNLIEAELRINELRDSVLYRDSWLRGQKIVVDRRESGVFTDGVMSGVNWVTDKNGNYIPGAWVGTPLADVSGYIGVSKTDLAELSTVGGSIFIASSGSLITRQGSLLDVSGGSVRYSDGWVNTTRLRGADGRIYDIADATPDRVYVGFAGGYTRSNARQGITETWTSALRKNGYFEKSYTEGRAAGSIQFYIAEGIVLEGDYWGGVVVGERQAVTGKYAQAGSLTFGGSSDDDRQWLIGKLFITSDPELLPPNFTATTPLASSWYAGAPGNADSFLLRTTYLDSDVLAGAGLGKIQLYLTGDVTLTQGTTLNLTPGSTFSLLANTVDSYRQDFKIDGVIRAPGGTVELRNAESVKFGAGAAIDVSGQWVNEIANGVAALAPSINGGSIKVANAQFEPGSVLDVSGGGWLQVRNRRLRTKAGDAGEITFESIDAAELVEADLRGFAAGSGGSLSFTTGANLQIGGDVPTALNTVRLSETLFSERGFRALSITAGNITVPADVTVTQLQRNIDLTDAARYASGTPMSKVGPLVVLPLAARVDLKPTSLSLSSNAIKVGAGAVVETDVGGSIKFGATGGLGSSIEIAGTLRAPAGKIDLSAQTLTVTDTGALLARGMPLIGMVAGGLRDGVVFDGGTVSLAAPTLALKAGSLIDVSGASGEIDLALPSTLAAHPTTAVTLASNGGTITISGQGLIEGAWRGHAGGEGARGGAISLAAMTAVPITLSETAQTGFVVRPSTLRSGGFTDLTLTSDTAVRLEGVDLTLGGSISIFGPLVNGNGTSSRLSAPYIVLRGAASGNPARAGTLTVAASLIDIQSASTRGFEQTVLEASDIRLTPIRLGLGVTLDVDGTLVLRAGQVYPTSQTNATIKASDKIVVQQNDMAGLALSVGGILTLDAPVIEQGGTLRAPFGQIVLKASQKLTLGAGSVTSVSGDGLVLPYGNLSNNESWTVVTTDNGQATVIASLPEKRITLDAPSVELAAGSVVDIRGGGDLHAWEHVPGPGGSHDVLSTPGVYAIVPALNNTVGGDRVWLDGGNGLAAGWYSLLPAHYALLPGGFAIQVVSGSQGKATQSATLADGSLIVTGYRANGLNGSRDQLSSNWRVMPGSVVRKYSEYNEAFANTFFASDAFKLTQYRLTGLNVVTPRLPMDGGAVVFKATQDLILNGYLRSQASGGGRGGLVDIAAQKIAIVGEDQNAGTLRADGYLVIGSTALSNFGAGSVLIGGVRSGDTQGLRVDVTADDIVVRNGSGSALTGSEIILAASETIDIGAGSVIRATGEAPTGAGDLVMTPQVAQVINNNGTPTNPSDDYVQTPARDWGALIRVSNGDVVRVRRTNVDTTVGGQVTVGAGAVLDGGKALLIDATGNATVTQATLSGAALSLASGRVGFGGGSGLVIDATALASLANTKHLTLRSYSTIDFYRGIDLSGLSAVTLDAAALVGYGTDPIAAVGNRLVLENTASTFSEPAGAGHGSLNLTAAELAFGEGAKALRGFDTVTVTGSTRIVGESNGSLDAGAAAVTFSTPVLTGRGGAGQSLSTTGAVIVAANGANTPARDESSLGARWSLTGSSIVFGGRADALGGAVELTATNGNVVLADGALIDVGGFGKQFFDVAEYTDAGRVTLKAVGGSVLMAAGAVLDLAAHPGGAGAGTLAIVSDGIQVVLDGTVKAQAAAGQRGGSFSLDIAALPSFSALNERLNQSGFSGARDFRIRSGDVTLDGTTVAESFRLAADQGHVTIAGTVDARARYGGSIAIYGGNGLTMTGSAVLRAGATDTVDNLGSGRITLGITGGQLAIQGGVIDVAGGEGGKVTLRAPVIEQAGADTVNVSFAGAIAGAREIVLEGYRSFDLAQLANNSNYVGVTVSTVNGRNQAELDLAATAAGKLNVLAEYGAGTLVEFVRDFDISAAYGALGGLSSQANFHARPGMELNYAGDIVLKSNWNLGAGIVNQTSAVTANVMAVDAAVGKAYVIAGKESELLRDHTTMVYRTGGSILGEAGVLTIRAEGDIELKGSITDGFFQFADPLDPTYLQVKGTSTLDTTVVFNGGRSNSSQNLTAYNGTATGLPQYYAGITWWRGSGAGGVKVTETSSTPPAIAGIPYSAEANSPAANSGNALAYAVMFPTITKADSSTVPVSSWSQTLVAGATPRGESSDPTRVVAGSVGKIVLSEQPGYNYFDSFVTATPKGYVDDGTFSISGSPTGAIGNMDTWIADLRTAAGTKLNDNSSAVLTIGVPSDKTYSYMLNLWNNYAASKGLTLQNDYRLYSSSASGANGQQEQRLNVITKFSTFADFYNTQVKPNLNSLAQFFQSAPSGTTGGTVTPSTVVRTGTGDINIVARGDLQLKSGASIYTAGRRDLAVYNDFTTGAATATYGVSGGHLRIDVGGNIDVALPTDRTQMQHYTEWLKRQGAVDTPSYLFTPVWQSSRPDRPAEQSAWWVDYANFKRGVGTLGGGNVDISAGGDLNNLTVAMPTNARVRGGRTATEQKVLELRNGGAMTIKAGGAVNAGYYYLGRGAGTIEAGEFAVGREVKVTNGSRVTSYPIAPIVSLGDATLDIRTAGDLRLQTFIDPLMVGKGEPNESVFFMSGQTERTALSLTSTGGDVTLVGQIEYLSKDVNTTSGANGAITTMNNFAGNIYPSKLRIAALNGSVINQSQYAATGTITTLYTMPSSNPELRILAANDLLPGSIVMSRATLEMIPSPFEPASGSTIYHVNLGNMGTGMYDLLANGIGGPPPGIPHALHLYYLRNPEHLPNENDYEPSRIYALNGSIIGTVASVGGSVVTSGITTNEQTWFRAGMDIRNISYSLRNIHTTDVSLLEAGNDIIGGPLQGSIYMQGPGALVLSAGRDVWAPTLSLMSVGNRAYDVNNRPIDYSQILGLPDQGVSITVMAGLKGKQPSYDAFVKAYLDPTNVASMPDYLKTTSADGTIFPIYLTDDYETRKSGQSHKVRSGLVSFIEEITGEKLTPQQAWIRFQTLPMLTRERFVRTIYMQELREAGDDQLEPGVNGLPRNGGYNRGYTAIETLFPGQDWKGDVTIGNALFRTMAGGDVEVLIPGGGLQVAALGKDAPSGYGLVTLGYGNINIFARDNVTVNRSRILTFAGGDEIIWSTLGDIDAGRGAKTARVPSAPEVTTDADAVTRVLEKADISGSGIGTIVGFTGVEEGDVALIAPQGTVNAGDAGVRVSGNLTLAARFVLNTENFSVAGEVKGLPPAKSTATGSLKLEGDTSKAANDAAKTAAQTAPAEHPSVIIVEVLGFGGGGGGNNNNNEPEQRPPSNQQTPSDQQSRYDPNGMFRVLGNGRFNGDQTKDLTDGEKRELETQLRRSGTQ